MYIQKVNYIDLSMVPSGIEVFDKLVENNPHNNGYCFRYIIEKDSYYDDLNKWLIEQGLSVGDLVIIHSNW